MEDMPDGTPAATAVPRADAIIHDDEDNEDNLDFGPYGDEEGMGLTDEQRALLVSFGSVRQDANRRQAHVAEAHARAEALAMRQAYEQSAPAAVHRAAR